MKGGHNQYGVGDMYSVSALRGTSKKMGPYYHVTTSPTYHVSHPRYH